jgi:CNT family concentrative nucleoside transporter
MASRRRFFAGKDEMARFSGLLGIIVLLAIAFIFSSDRRAIRLKTVVWGLALQFLFAFLVLRTPQGGAAMKYAGLGVKKFLDYTVAGSSFVFGNLGMDFPAGVLAFRVLPTIIFASAFFALMYHVGVMQLIIRAMAWAMTRLMGVSGAESLNVAASVFVGQIEAPLSIRPFLSEATRSELMTIMTAGMAHVSGGTLAGYIAFGIEPSHLLAAVIMTAPGSILIAKMFVPETEQPKTSGRVEMPENASHKGENFLSAIARGTVDGGQLAFTVAIMLISFLALIAAINGIMGSIHTYWHWFPDSLQVVLGKIFAPLAWLLGVSWHDSLDVGKFLGTRMVTNELFAYSQLGAQKYLLDPRSVTIATFALCGFANLGSIGIQIGGIGALAPKRRNDLARLGFRAMIAGTMANFLSAAIVGLLFKS